MFSSVNTNTSLLQDAHAVLKFVQAVDDIISSSKTKTESKPESKAESKPETKPEFKAESNEPVAPGPVEGPEPVPEPAAREECVKPSPSSRLHYNYTIFNEKGLPEQVVYTERPVPPKTVPVQNVPRVQPQQVVYDPDVAFLDDLVLFLLCVTVTFIIANALGQYVGRQLRALLQVRANEERAKTNLSLADLELRMSERMKDLEARLDQLSVPVVPKQTEPEVSA